MNALFDADTQEPQKCSFANISVLCKSLCILTYTRSKPTSVHCCSLSQNNRNQESNLFPPLPLRDPLVPSCAMICDWWIPLKLPLWPVPGLLSHSDRLHTSDWSLAAVSCGPYGRCAARPGWWGAPRLILFSLGMEIMKGSGVCVRVHVRLHPLRGLSQLFCPGGCIGGAGWFNAERLGLSTEVIAHSTLY